MTSHVNKKFRKLAAELPAEVQKQAKQAYFIWSNDPWDSRLRFKQIHPVEPVYSARIALGWRAIGIRLGDLMIWCWIGSHAEYGRLTGKF